MKKEEEETNYVCCCCCCLILLYSSYYYPIIIINFIIIIILLLQDGGDGDCYPGSVPSGYQANRVHHGKNSKLASLITHLRPIGICIKTLSLPLHTN